jgi:hypothetical protein
MPVQARASVTVNAHGPCSLGRELPGLGEPHRMGSRIWTARWDLWRPMLIRLGRIDLSPPEQIRTQPACHFEQCEGTGTETVRADGLRPPSDPD